MKKQYLHTAAAVVLVLLVVFLIAGRIFPRELESMLPKGFQPESSHVGFFGWSEGDWIQDRDLSEEELQILWTYLNTLEYRYDGSVPGGVMKGELYHLNLFQQEPPELVNLYITKTRGVVYLNDKEYEMIGNTNPLLDFLNNLR